MNKVLIINAHQRYEGFAEGKLNQTLCDTASQMLEGKGYEIKTTHVEKGYDVAQELEKYRWADKITHGKATQQPERQKVRVFANGIALRNRAIPQVRS